MSVVYQAGGGDSGTSGVAGCRTFGMVTPLKAAAGASEVTLLAKACSCGIRADRTEATHDFSNAGTKPIRRSADWTVVGFCAVWNAYHGLSHRERIIGFDLSRLRLQPTSFFANRRLHFMLNGRITLPISKRKINFAALVHGLECGRVAAIPEPRHNTGRTEEPGLLVQ